MKYRFYNARILTMDPLCEEGDTSVFRGEVHTEDGKVTYVGEPGNLTGRSTVRGIS